MGEPNPLLKKKCSRYAWVQKKYWSDRADLAGWILDGNEESVSRIEPSVASVAYQNIWGREDQFVSLGRFADLPGADMSSICSQITFWRSWG